MSNECFREEKEIVVPINDIHSIFVVFTIVPCHAVLLFRRRCRRCRRCRRRFRISCLPHINTYYSA